jgi:hypothetical protein
LAIASAVVVPYVLMHSTLADVRSYWLAATLCLLAVFATGSLVQPMPSLSWQTIVSGFAGAGLAGGVIVTSTLLGGVSPYWLLRGIVLDPSKHPQGYLIPMSVSPGVAVVLGISTAVAWLSLRGRLKAYADLTGALACMVGLLAALFILVFRSAAGYPPPRIDWAVSLLPIGLIHSGRDWRALFPRLFITDMAATQFLQIYPVGGHQAYIAAAPVLLWAFVCIIDGISGLSALLRRVVPMGKSALLKAAALLVLLFVVGGTRHSGLLRYLRHSDPASNLAGMHSVRLPPPVEARYEFLVASVRANCDLLFSMPGIESLNLWSGVATPDGSNISNWMPSLGVDKQQRVLEILQAHPRACVISSADLLEFWLTKPQFLATALPTYILNEMPIVARRDGYEIRVHPRRTAAWTQ